MTMITTITGENCSTWDCIGEGRKHKKPEDTRGLRELIMEGGVDDDGNNPR